MNRTTTFPFSALWRALTMGGRAALFLPVSAANREATWSQLMHLTVLSLLIQFLSDLAGTGLQGQFVAHGLPAALFGLPVILFAAWIIAGRLGQPEKILLLAVAFSATAIFVDLAYHLLIGLAQNSMPDAYQALAFYGFYLAVIWFVLATTFLALRLLALPAKRWLSPLLLSTLLMGLPLALVYRNPTLWTKPYDPSSRKEASAVVTEAMLYQQPVLLQKQLAALKAGRKGAVDLYFIGVAGYAGQDVFMKEIQTVTSLFDQRFHTQNRSVMLINNPKTAASIPLASVTSLGESLKHIGELMNRDEDILFLFLTSHGSKDHRFALEYGALQFDELHPERLRALLDASGIKQRVIVVSACYSGGFVDALKDPHSLVITAAAPDRNSFGCSNENDFTYFGRAYFDEALRQTQDFITAFELATPVIAKREEEEKYLQSHPQIFVGAEIRAALNELMQQNSASKN